MQIKSDYFSASFISFVIHATIILYLTDFFYFEKQQRPVLSKPVNVNLLFIKIDLIKSSGNIRFDNSAIKAISRVETFSFFNKIPFSMYQTSFKNIVITFNPV